MLDVKKLERRWLKYKLRRYTPWLGGTVAIIIIPTTIFFLWDNDAPLIVAHNTTLATNQSNAVKPISPTATIPENNDTFIEPSMSFIDSYSNIPQPVIQPPRETQIIVPAKKTTLPAQQQSITSNEPPSSKISPQPMSKSVKNEVPLAINRNESKLDIEELERRFKNGSNADLGLFIARYYYDHGNYNEALNYALKTNEINKNLESSWLIFAKSLVKLGKVEQAKKTLQIYLDQSNSESAKSLLNSIEQGTFK